MISSKESIARKRSVQILILTCGLLLLIVLFAWFFQEQIGKSFLNIAILMFVMSVLVVRSIVTLIDLRKKSYDQRNLRKHQELLMENSEEILAILKAVDDSLGRYMLFEIFDLCITNKRLVVINPKSYNRWFKMWGISVWIQRREEAKKRLKQDPLKGLTIDELLEKDKSSYAINYDELEYIYLNKSLFGSNLNLKGKKIGKLIKINKEQYDQLSQILPKIEAVKGKFEINQ